MKKIIPVVLALVVIGIVAISSCTKTVKDDSYIRCTCTYKDAAGANHTVYNDIDKIHYPTTASQQSECNDFGAGIVGTSMSCHL